MKFITVFPIDHC